MSFAPTSKPAASNQAAQTVELLTRSKTAHKMTVQPGQAIKIMVDGQVYTGQKTIKGQALNLKRKGDTLLLVAEDQAEPLLEVSGFYAPGTTPENANLSADASQATWVDAHALLQESTSTQLASADLGSSASAVTSTPSWGTLIAQAGSAVGTTATTTATATTAATAATATTATAATATAATAAVGAASVGAVAAAVAVAAVAISSSNSSDQATADTTAPTLTITDNADGTAKGPVTFTFTFSEAVTGFTADSVTVAYGSSGTFTANNGTFTAISATQYTLVVTPDASYSGDMIFHVANAGIKDAAGNVLATAATYKQPVEPAGTVISVTVAFGPQTDRGQGTEVTLYRADDSSVLGKATYNARTEKFEYIDTSNPPYKGVLIAKMVDTDPDADYLDEATGRTQSAEGVYLAVVNVDGLGTAVSANVNPLTTVAAQKMGVSAQADSTTAPTVPTTGLSKDDVNNTNQAVAKAFNIVDANGNSLDITTASVTTVVNAAGDAVDGNAYGKALAVVSQMEQVGVLSTAQIVAKVTDALDVSKGALTAAASTETQILYVQAAVQTAAKSQIATTEVGNLVKAATTETVANVTNSSSTATLTALQVAALTADDIAILTPAQIEALRNNLARLSDTALGSLKADQLANVSADQVSALGIKVFSLSSAAVTGANAAITNGLTSQMPQDASGVAALGNKLANLSGTALAALSPTQLAGISATQIDVLSGDQLKTMGVKLAQLSASAVASLDATQLAAIAPANLGAQVLKLSASELTKITDTAVTDAIGDAQITALSGLSATDVAALGKQVAALTNAALAKLSATQAAGLTAQQVGALSATTQTKLAQLAKLSPEAFAGLSVTAIASLTSDQLGALTGLQLAQLTADQMHALSATQVQSLSSAALSQLSTAALGALTGTQLASLSDAQLTGLGGKIASVLVSALTSLSTAQLSTVQTALGATLAAEVTAAKTTAAATTSGTGLTADSLAKLDAAVTSALSTTVIGQLTGEALSGLKTEALTAAQVAVLTGAQIKDLSTTQIGKLSPSAVASLSAAAIGSLDASQLGALTSAQVAQLTASQLKTLAANVGSLSATAIASLSASAVASLDGTQLNALAAKLGASQVTSLSATQIGQLTATAVGHLANSALAQLSATQVRAITADQAPALSGTQIDALSPTQVSNLSAAAVAKLSTAALQSLDASQLAALTGVQASALTGSQVADLGAGLSSLGNTALAQIKATDTTAMTALSGQLASLSTSQVVALSSAQIAALNLTALTDAAKLSAFAASLTSAQAKALTAAQLATIAALTLGNTLIDDAAPVTGTVASGGITNDATPTFSGTVGKLPAGAVVAVYDTTSVDGKDVTTKLGEAIVGSAGSWTFTPATALSAQGAHKITARVEVAGGKSSDPIATSLAFTLDTVAPTVKTVGIDSASGNQGTLLNAGDTVVLKVQMADTVTVAGVDASNKPQLELTIGSAKVTADYVGFDADTNTLSFSYKVLPGQTADSGIAIAANALSIVGTATVRDAAGNNADLAHALVNANTSYKVDTTGPVISTTTLSAAEKGTAVDKLAGTDTNGITWTLDGTADDNDNFNLAKDGTLAFPRAPDFEAPGSAKGSNAYTVNVKATDDAGNVSTQTITVNVTDVNEAPTAVALSSSSSTLSELADTTKTSTATKLADITITDDALGANTITLTGADKDKGKFEVVGNALYLKAGVTLDYETATDHQYQVTVNVADSSVSGNPVSTSYVLNLTNINEAPTFGTLATIKLDDTFENNIFENQAGQLPGQDVDASTTLSYGIANTTPLNQATTIGTVGYDVSQAGTYGTLYVESSTGKYVYVANAAAINALTSSQTETFTVTTYDGALSGTATLTVNVTGADDAPVLVSSFTTTGNTPVAGNSDYLQMIVGQAPSSINFGNFYRDVDTGDASPTFEIVSVGGDTTVKTIEGLTFNANGTFTGKPTDAGGTYPKDYSVVIRALDASNRAVYTDHTYVVHMLKAPVIQSFSVADTNIANGPNLGKSGETLDVAVLFSEVVNVTGSPTITLSINGQPVTGTYVSGHQNSDKTLHFSATVPTGSDADGSNITITGVTANGSGNSVIGQDSSQPWDATPMPQAYAGYTVDNTAPTLSITSYDVNESTTLPASDVVVATLVGTDASSMKYTLGSTGADNGLFSLAGGVLKLTAGKSFEDTATHANVYNLTVDITDTAGNVLDEKAITVNLKDVNEAPTGVSLTNVTSSLKEDAGTTTRTKVADISITDDALVSSNAISLAGDDKNSFEVVGNALYLKAGVALNYEGSPAKTSYAVTVNVADSTVADSSAVSTDYTLTLTNVNEAPTLVTPTAITLNDFERKDSFANQTGKLQGNDVDASTTLSYGIANTTPLNQATTIDNDAYNVSKAGTYGTLYVQSSTGKYVYVANAAAINALTSNQNETFTVTVADNAVTPLNATATLTVNVTGADDAPVLVSSFTTTGNTPVAGNSDYLQMIVGQTPATNFGVFYEDPDTGDAAPTFQIVSVNNNTATTAIPGLTLNADGTFTGKPNDAGGTYPKDYSVVIRALDASNPAVYTDHTYVVHMLKAPVIQSFSVTDNTVSGTNTDTLGKSGETLDVAVVFSEVVNVTGSPTITLSINGQPVTGTYVSGHQNSDKTLHFSATVPTGSDADGSNITITGVTANGSGNSVIGQDSSQPWDATPMPQAYAGYTVDNTAPTLSITSYDVNESTTLPASDVVVATLVGTDASSMKYTLGSTGADNGLFSLAGGVLKLTAGKSFEDTATHANVYNLTVDITDTAGNVLDEKAITVNLKDVNEAPQLSAQTANVTNAVKGEGLTPISVANAFTDPDTQTAAFHDMYYDLTATLGGQPVSLTTAGLSIDHATGAITGALTASGTYALTVTAWDGGALNTGLSATETFNVTANQRPALTSSQTLDGQTNLSVQSALVIAFDQAITIGGGHIKIYDDMGTAGWSHDLTNAPNAGKSESVVDTYKNDVDITIDAATHKATSVLINGIDRSDRFDLNNSVTTDGNNLVIDLKQKVASGTGAGTWSTAFDWDFGAWYHVNFDAGIVQNTAGLGNAALTDGSANATGAQQNTTLNFTTVTPTDMGALSKVITSTLGAVSVADSFYWINGNQSATGTGDAQVLLDLAGKNFAVVMDSNGSNSASGGLQSNVKLKNFGFDNSTWNRNDFLYFDNHGNQALLTTDGLNAATSGWNSTQTSRQMTDTGAIGGSSFVFIDNTGYPTGSTWGSGITSEGGFENKFAYNAVIFG